MGTQQWEAVTGPLSFQPGETKIEVRVATSDDNEVESDVYLDLGALGVPSGSQVRLRDELTGASFTWETRNYVKLSPNNPAHILHLL